MPEHSRTSGGDDRASVTPGTAARDDAVIRAWLRHAAAAVHEARTHLTDLDAAIGDGDHGINLDRGFTALLADLDAARPGDADDAAGQGAAGPADAADPGSTLVAAGRRLMGVVGGASGALYGRGLMVAGERVRGLPSESHPVADLVAAILDGLIAGITGLGHAVPGDKTMLDTLAPAAGILRHPPSASPAAALRAMAGAADLGALQTTPLVARKGRASYLGERSAGHEDPGAASAALLVRCLAEAALDQLADGPANPQAGAAHPSAGASNPPGGPSAPR